MVSIIIPTYNRANLIGETLDSVLAQTYQDWECIVVDDGSTDNTEVVVEAFAKADKRFSYYRRPKNLPKGANACRNFGFDLSEGKYIQWFDSDDLLLPDALSKLVEGIKNDFDAVTCAFHFFNAEKKLGIFNSNLKNDIWTEFYSHRLTFNTPSFLYRRTAILYIKFDETLSRAQDLDFVFRVCSSIKKLNYIDDDLVAVRQHKKSIGYEFKKPSVKSLKDEIKIRKRILKKTRTDPQLYGFYPETLRHFCVLLRKLIVHKYYRDFIMEILALPIGFGYRVALLMYGFPIATLKRGKTQYSRYCSAITKSL